MKALGGSEGVREAEARKHNLNFLFQDLEDERCLEEKLGSFIVHNHFLLMLTFAAYQDSMYSLVRHQACDLYMSKRKVTAF